MRFGLALATWMVIERAALAGPPQQEPDTLRPPDAERAPAASTAAAHVIDLPAVPSFELPVTEPGLYDPRFVRVRGKQLLDTEIKVKGYVIWIYDCLSDARSGKETRAQTQRRIDADPTLCERPKLYLGEARDTLRERGLWVVDVPRPPNRLEKQRLPKEELAAWPAVPKYKVGDYVIVTGTLAIESPHRERNSDGLLVYQAIERARPPRSKRSAQARATHAAPAITTPTSAPPTTATPAAAPAPMRDAVDPKVVNISNLAVDIAHRAAANKQFERALDYYQRAIAAWPGNHVAWYGRGLVLIQQDDPRAASEAFATAVKLRPDLAMYQLWAGVAAYEVVRTASTSRDKARAALERAVAIDPALWRAHYYLGRIARDEQRERDAAEQFSAAIRYNPTQQAAYVALAELYRKWDYPALAVAVASIGARELGAVPAASDVQYVLGMAQTELGAHAKAIAAFTRALELSPDNHKARYQRGVVYFRHGKHEDARRDLEAFVAAAPDSLSFARQQAESLLAELDAAH